eukprot:6180424-Pleurochrysis_carterae.AAC.1
MHMQRKDPDHGHSICNIRKELLPTQSCAPYYKNHCDQHPTTNTKTIISKPSSPASSTNACPDATASHSACPRASHSACPRAPCAATSRGH